MEGGRTPEGCRWDASGNKGKVTWFLPSCLPVFCKCLLLANPTQKLEGWRSGRCSFLWCSAEQGKGRMRARASRQVTDTGMIAHIYILLFIPSDIYTYRNSRVSSFSPLYTMIQFGDRDIHLFRLKQKLSNLCRVIVKPISNAYHVLFFYSDLSSQTVDETNNERYTSPGTHFQTKLNLGKDIRQSGDLFKVTLRTEFHSINNLGTG